MNYFSWNRADRDHYEGHERLELRRQVNLLKVYQSEKESVNFFQSVQSYDSKGNLLSCPIYADLDGENAHPETIELVKAMINSFGVVPIVYFSGKKGFHVLINSPIRHSHPHLIAKEIVTGICPNLETLDLRVYSALRMFRLEGSVHSGTGLYKTRLTLDQLINSQMYEIRELAKDHKRYVLENEIVTNEKIAKAIMIAKQHFNLRPKREKREERVETGLRYIPPCIEYVLKHEPLNGEWNHTITDLAKFFNRFGLNEYTALDVMFQFDHWVDDERHVRKVFKSIFRSQSYFPCTNSSILDEQCVLKCRYNKELTDRFRERVQ